MAEGRAEDIIRRSWRQHQCQIRLREVMVRVQQALLTVGDEGRRHDSEAARLCDVQQAWGAILDKFPPNAPLAL